MIFFQYRWKSKPRNDTFFSIEIVQFGLFTTRKKVGYMQISYTESTKNITLDIHTHYNNKKQSSTCSFSIN